MHNDIQPFTFPDTGQQVRTFSLDGEPWFVATDATQVLGYRSASDATRWLDEDEKGTHSVRTPGGRQNVTIINEAGLYSLILRSKAEKARDFKRWVTHEVLPSIRKTGSYAIPSREVDLSTPDGIVALAERFLETAQKLAIAAPKAEAHDALMSAPGALLVREAAKTLRMQERALRMFLLEEHMLFARQILCGATQYDFYAPFAEHFMSKLTVVEHNFGGKCAHTTVYVTPRGMDLIRKRLAAQSTEIAIAAGGVR